MIMGLVYSLALSLALTLALEIGFYLLFGNTALSGKRSKRNLLLVVLVNTLTNPIVVLLYSLAAMYTQWNMAAVLILLELFAILAEGCYYRKYGDGFRRPYLFSAAANMFSFWVGMLIQPPI